MSFKSLKYFSLKDSYEENKKLHRILVNQYHPDKPTGNEDMMKEINAEWETIEKYFTSGKQPISDTINMNQDIIFESILYAVNQIFQKPYKSESSPINYIIFNGIKYNLDDSKLLEKIALRHGGLGLMEFMNSKEWQDYIKNS